MDSKHFLWVSGTVKSKVVTDPIMTGINSNGRVFIILTFDVYDLQGKKIAKKVSEVFHDDPGVYEWDFGVKSWQGSYRIYADSHAGHGMGIEKIAERIRILLNGGSIREPHRFNYGDESYIKLWKKPLI